MDKENRNNDHKDIELRSDEVQEIMARIPNAFLHYGMTVVIVVILLFLFGSIMFRYPEIVEGKCTLRSVPSTAKVFANQDGYIETIVIPNNFNVTQGETIAILQSKLPFRIVKNLTSKLSMWLNSGAKIVELESVFYDDYPDLGKFQGLYNQTYSNWSSYLNNPSIESRHLLYSSVVELRNELDQFIQKISLTSPIDGVLKYMNFMDEGQAIYEGDLVCVIEPTDSVQTYGNISVATSNIELIELDQSVQIVLESYPENTFGYITASVSFISPIPDNDGFYNIGVKLPENLTTSNGFVIPSIRECAGTARIITKDRSLFSRLINI